MFCVLDGWDQVPYRSDLTDLKQLPETLQGTAAADFIMAELTAILPNLPDGPYQSNEDAAKALMMKLLLNKGVYANRQTPTFAAADMTQVITLADQIIASARNYSLTANFFDNSGRDNYRFQRS